MWYFCRLSISTISHFVLRKYVDSKTPRDTYRHSATAKPCGTQSVPSHVTAVYVYSYLISGPIVTPDLQINSVKLTMSSSLLSPDLLQVPPGGTAPPAGRLHLLRAALTGWFNQREKCIRLCLEKDCSLGYSKMKVRRGFCDRL